MTGGSEDFPLVNVGWRGGMWTMEGVDLDVGIVPDATVNVAQLVARGLIECEGIYWPTCPADRRRLTSTLASGSEPVWLCARSGKRHHLVSKIGELFTRATPRHDLSPSLDGLARP